MKHTYSLLSCFDCCGSQLWRPFDIHLCFILFQLGISHALVFRLGFVYTVVFKQGIFNIFVVSGNFLHSSFWCFCLVNFPYFSVAVWNFLYISVAVWNFLYFRVSAGNFMCISVPLVCQQEIFYSLLFVCREQAVTVAPRSQCNAQWWWNST